MLEKQIVDVIAPLADEVIALKKRLDAAPIPSNGKDGKDGKDGADAPALDVDAVVKGLIPHIPAPIKGDIGPAGTAASAQEVAEVIKSDSIFVDALRGNGIKSLTTDGVKMTFGFDNGDEIEIDLPVGPAGETGPAGNAGERGEKGADGLGVEVKLWEPGVHREGVYRAANFGQIFKAVRDTASAPGSEDWERIGSYGFAWTGLKQADRAYQDGDLYIDGGSAFVWYGGKAHMFCQKGARGAQGEAGKDGKNGQDAPTLIHMRMTEKSVDMVMSDGTVFEAEIEGYEKAIDSLVQSKLLNWLEAEAQQIENEGGTPLRSFRGQFLYNESYSVGDVVVFNKTLYVARKANRKDFVLEDWRKVYTGGGGGGGGGSGGGWNYIAMQSINMNTLGISNLAPPRIGSAGQLDAVNRTFLESAIAAGSLFQGTVTEATQNKLPALPDPTTKGHYWTWVGSANHVVGPLDTALNADLNGNLLQVGDWIQSNGVSWSHVPGDLLTKQRWHTLGGFTDWVAGQSYEVGSLVHYQGHLYRAETALTGAAGETAPNVRAQPITVSFAAVTPGKHYTITVSGGITTGNAVLNINLDVDDTLGVDTQTAPVIAGQTAANVAAAIVGGWSNTSTTAVLRQNTSIIDVKVVNQTDTITTLGINQTTLDAANSLGGNVQRWTDISPRMNLSDLADTGILQPAKSDHLIYDGTRWANKNPFVQMTKAAYTALGTNVDPDVLYLIKG